MRCSVEDEDVVLRPETTLPLVMGSEQNASNEIERREDGEKPEFTALEDEDLLPYHLHPILFPDFLKEFGSRADMDPNPRAALERQQLRLRERQKFFEDILQPETEFVFPLSHLHLESQRPPIGSISSMEVNVDTLEQVELIDLGDQDGTDVFLPCEDPPPTPQTSGVEDHLEELSLPLPAPDRTTSRTSSLSSDSSTNLHSPNPSDGGADTPLAQSDEEEDGGDGGAEPGTCS
ncbi:Dysbindin domain-containing protein 2 [Sciurus carolinensis]|uniref:Dysbindin domain-containing protein 2 n=2 Tax=Sciurus TaxID=10001 RepID=A0AA41TAV4_SCICA|nr:Dysbindin domain-containing protein 2 [Sciurus carolinensis]